MKMENPYHTLGEAFVSSVIAGGRGKIEGKQEGLSERLRQYAFYVQENAVEAGDALLVNDLLDAAKRLRVVTPDEPQAAPVTADQAAEDVRREREAKSERDRYANMTTAEKCAVQGDGFINDYD